MKKICLGTILMMQTIASIASQNTTTKNIVSECAHQKDSCTPKKMIHVPSPIWQDQIIYSLMIDHFNDGDRSRNDQGFGLYRPQVEGFYSGGDIPGITQKISYLKNLGITTLLISPPVANQWWNGWLKSTGYHGYWPVNFREVDAHYGSLEDYKTLVSTLHTNNMYLIQDAVLNHVAPYYEYTGPYDSNNKTKNFHLNQDSIPKIPSQAPFDKIDLLDPEDANADIYHWTPQITDYTDLNQSYNYQVAFVNDLNTSNPVVRKTLTESHTYWIDEVGVDGFRFDAVKHVEPDFWEQFMNGPEGVLANARSTGRKDFFTFGEAYNFSDPYQNYGEKIALMNLSYENKPTIKTLLGYPLYNELRRVLNDGGATAYLSYRINAQMTLFPDPFTVPNFINNHDVERFQKNSNTQSYEQAWAVLLTIPGIPVIYQGDEQNFKPIRKAMFKGGFKAKRDHFDTDSHFFTQIKSLIQLRTHHKIFTRGNFAAVQDNSAGPGILAYTRHYQEDTALVVLNTSDVFSALVNIPAGTFPPNHRLQLLFSNSESSQHMENMVTGPNGELIFEAAARTTLIFKLDKKPLHKSKTQTHWLTIDQQLDNNEIGKTTDLSGRLSEANTEMLLVINGNLDGAKKLSSDTKGFWKASLPALGLQNKPEEFSIYAPSLKLASPTQHFSVVAQDGINHYRQEDPLGDDLGPHQSYKKPLLNTYQQQFDIKAIEVRHRGPVLELSIEMPEITDIFAYPNGFDHVGFHIYFDVKKLGSQLLPQLNAKTPTGMDWDIAHFAFCAGNYVYLDTGSNAKNPGRRVNLTPILNVNHAKKTFTFTYDFSALGIDNWYGKKIYITTWDRNQDGLKALTPSPTNASFGGDPQGPKILDDILVIIPQSDSTSL
jgi:glycosidase